MKSGASRKDVNQIKLGYKKGMNADQMSQILQVPLETVKSFDPERARSTETPPDYTLPESTFVEDDEPAFVEDDPEDDPED